MAQSRRDRSTLSSRESTLRKRCRPILTQCSLLSMPLTCNSRPSTWPAACRRSILCVLDRSQLGSGHSAGNHRDPLRCYGLTRGACTPLRTARGLAVLCQAPQTLVWQCGTSFPTDSTVCGCLEFEKWSGRGSRAGHGNEEQRRR